MTNKPIKILCVGRDDRITHLVDGIFRSITHETHHQTDLQNIKERISEGTYDLLIVHADDNIRFTKEVLQEIRLFRPGLVVILVASEQEDDHIWIKEQGVYWVEENKLVTALPLALGDFYSRYGEEGNGSLLRHNLLFNSLLAVNRGLIILDARGEVQLFNLSAEQLLDLPAKTDLHITFFDFVNDGEKIWHYFTEQCPDKTERIDNYPVVIRDLNNKETSRLVDITCIDKENLYYLLQIGPASGHSTINEGENGYDLLAKFAESVANELLNPVNIISGRLQLLRSELPDEERYLKSLTALEKQAERINETVGKLATFAHLKEDTVPQDVDINTLLNRILLEPSIARLREMDDISLTYELGKPPLIMGTSSHFSLLLKTLLEVCFNCLGSRGEIIVQTTERKKYLNKNWAEINFILNYSSSTFGNDITLQTILGKQEDTIRLKSIESAIIKHYIHHYKGNYSVLSLSPDQEKLSLRFPAKVK